LIVTPLAEQTFERILLIKPSSPGDIIHALPVLHALRKRYPAARIEWLVATAFADLISADPALDEVVPFDRKRFGLLGRSVTVSRDFLRFVAGLRRRRYDLVIDLQGLFRSGFLAFASGAPVRIGFADAREIAPLFYTHKFRAAEGLEHAADRNFAVGDLLGFQDKHLDFTVVLLDDDRSRARALLAEAGVAEADACVVLVPRTRWETKCWAADRFGQLAAELFRTRGIRSVLVGGESDVPAGRQAVAGSAGAAANLCGRTSLRQLAALIESAALVITADSTPMHLAAAFDRPLIALFGPTNPRRTGPYARLADVLRLDLPCSPCYYRHLHQCPHDHACMRDLTVAQVLAAAHARLDAHRPVLTGVRP